MKKLTKILFLWMAALLLGVSACKAQEAADPAKDKQAIVSLVKALYKVKPDSYYFAEFPGYSVKKHDEMAEKFFVVSLFPREVGTKTTPIQTHKLPNLYPREEDPNALIAENRNEPLPKIKIDTPELDGQRGKVLVRLSDESLVHFFLQKSLDGWRIYKVRTFSSDPGNLYFLGSNKGPNGFFGYMVEYPSGKSFSEENVDMTLSLW